MTLTTNNVDNISTNALTSAANRVRTLSAANDTDIVVYAIGLGNNSTPPDADLLGRIANVVTSSYYNSSYPAGKMLYANDNSELQSAFGQLASETLRLSR